MIYFVNHSKTFNVDKINKPIGYDFFNGQEFKLGNFIIKVKIYYTSGMSDEPVVLPCVVMNAKREVLAHLVDFNEKEDIIEDGIKKETGFLLLNNMTEKEYDKLYKKALTFIKKEYGVLSDRVVVDQTDDVIFDEIEVASENIIKNVKNLSTKYGTQFVLYVYINLYPSELKTLVDNIGSEYKIINLVRHPLIDYVLSPSLHKEDEVSNSKPTQPNIGVFGLEPETVHSWISSILLSEDKLFRDKLINIRYEDINFLKHVDFFGSKIELMVEPINDFITQADKEYISSEDFEMNFEEKLKNLDKILKLVEFNTDIGDPDIMIDSLNKKVTNNANVLKFIIAINQGTLMLPSVWSDKGKLKTNIDNDGVFPEITEEECVKGLENLKVIQRIKTEKNGFLKYFNYNYKMDLRKLIYGE